MKKSPIDKKNMNCCQTKYRQEQETLENIERRSVGCIGYLMTNPAYTYTYIKYVNK